jgi:hypothetical protein
MEALMAGKPIGKVAMTKTERQRKWRAKVRRKKIWGRNRDPSARRPTPRRSDLDFWPTPPCLTAALIEVVLPLLPLGPIWEFAAGDGTLADALIAAGRQVFASDVERQRPGLCNTISLTTRRRQPRMERSASRIRHSPARTSATPSSGARLSCSTPDTSALRCCCSALMPAAQTAAPMSSIALLGRSPAAGDRCGFPERRAAARGGPNGSSGSQGNQGRQSAAAFGAVIYTKLFFENFSEL